MKKPKQLSIVFLLIFFPIICAADSSCETYRENIVYHVSKHPNRSEILTVSLTLPGGTGNGSRELFTRGLHLGVSPQITNVRCKGKIIHHDENHKWAIPEDCRKVVWDVKLFPSGPSILEISKQQSVIVESDPPWILLSEFSFLPRIEFDDHTSVISFDPSLENKITTFLPKDSKNRRILPSVNEPPVFFVFGLNPSRYKSPLGTSLNYLIDEKSARNEINSFYSMHIKSIDYMKSLFGLSDDIDFRLNVVWIGLRKKGMISGAAGFRTFLINYLFIDGKILKDKFIWSLMTAFHEQFHVLSQSETSKPVWIEESLAQYYAIKTLDKVGFDQDLLKPIKEHFIQPSSKYEIGLEEANRRFKLENDLSVYHLFYEQGASFWFELDKLIMDCTQGKKNLDNFIGKLLKMNFSEGEKLPKKFIDILHFNNISGVDPLIKKYL